MTVASQQSTIPANVGSVLIWKGMVKFNLHWDWVWLARSEDGHVTARSRDGKTDRTAELSSHEMRAAIQFLLHSPI